MNERILLDTDVSIRLLRQQPETKISFIYYYEQGTVFLLSPIVVAEIYAGAFPEEYPTIEAFFTLCEPLPLNNETAKQAGLYAKQYRKAYNNISLEDYLLAATAKIEDCQLWIYNRKHFPMPEVSIFKA
jgi:hypothetical protein